MANVSGGQKGARRLDALHSIEHDRALAHAKIIVGAPNIHLIFDAGGMSNGELVSESVNIVKISDNSCHRASCQVQCGKSARSRSGLA